MTDRPGGAAELPIVGKIRRQGEYYDKMMNLNPVMTVHFSAWRLTQDFFSALDPL
jgi:hypothetical protein